jgi:hypothetical protein
VRHIRQQNISVRFQGFGESIRFVIVNDAVRSVVDSGDSMLSRLELRAQPQQFRVGVRCCGRRWKVSGGSGRHTGNRQQNSRAAQAAAVKRALMPHTPRL